MSFIKKTWLARIGTGLNRFLQNGTDYVTLQSAPESVTQQGDALSADNMNNLEQRIEDAFDALDDEILTDEPSTTDTTHALTNAIATQIHKQTNARLENLEQKAGDYVEVQYRGTNAVPTGKAKYGIVNTIVGKTRAWNQIVKNGDFSDGSNNWSPNGATSISVSSGIASFTATTPAGMIRQSCSFINGHKYLAIARVKTTTATNLVLLNVSSSSGGGVAQSAESTNWQTIYLVFTQSGNADNFIRIQDNRTSGWDEIQIDYVFCRDITPIFGAGNEPSTVAEALQRLPDLAKYNAYDAGSLVSTEVSGVESIGVNMLNPAQLSSIGTWVDGKLTATAKAFNLFTKNAGWENINYVPNTRYYFSVKVKGTIGMTNFRIRVDYTDNTYSNSAYVSGDTEAVTSVLSTQGKTVKSILFDYSSGADNNVTISEFIIKIHDEKDGTFYPYERHALMLPTPFIGKSAGSVAEKLNVATGEVTHPVGTYTFTGNETWSAFGAGYRAEVLSPNCVSDNNHVNCLAVFGNESLANLYTGVSYPAIGCASSSIVLSASAYTDRANLIGTQINYVLATPDPSTNIGATPYNFLEVEGGGTVETIQEQSPVIDNCLDVGYLAL